MKDSLKVVLPENISEITLEQYQKYTALIKRDSLPKVEFDRRKISIFTSIPYRNIKDISQKDYDGVLSQIDKALNVDAPFKNKFTLNGVTYGMIPNFDKISNAEFVDLSEYGTDIETLHKLMSIIFRPVTNSDALGNYVIEPYTGTEKYGNTMKDMPINIVNGALEFFFLLAKELRIHTQRYTDQLQAKVEVLQATLKSGAGMQQ